MAVDVKFEQEGNIKRVSFLRTKKLFAVVLVLLLVGGIVFSLSIRYGTKNQPFWVWVIVSFLLYTSLYPRKTLLEYDSISKKLTIKNYGPIRFLNFPNAIMVYTDEMLKASNKIHNKISVFPSGNLTMNYYTSFPWLINTINREQSIKISKFLGINLDLGIPHLYG